MPITPAENQQKLAAAIKSWQKTITVFEKELIEMFNTAKSVGLNAKEHRGYIGILAIEASKSIQFARDLGAEGKKWQDFNDIDDVKKTLQLFENYAKGTVTSTDKSLTGARLKCEGASDMILGLKKEVEKEAAVQAEFYKKAKVAEPKDLKTLGEVKVSIQKLQNDIQELRDDLKVQAVDYLGNARQEFQAAMVAAFGKTRANKEAVEQQEMLDRSFDGRSMKTLLAKAAGIYKKLVDTTPMIELARLAEQPVDPKDAKDEIKELSERMKELLDLRKGHKDKLDTLNNLGLGSLNGKNAVIVLKDLDKFVGAAEKFRDSVVVYVKANLAK